MRRLAETDDARIPDAIEKRPEVGGLDVVEPLGLLANQRRDRLGAARHPSLERHGLVGIRRPPLHADERHEADRPQVLADQPAVVLLAQAQKPLGVAALADGKHEAATRRELLDQGFGDRRRPGGDGDGLEGRVLGPAERPVSVAHLDVVVTEHLETAACGPGEFGMTFDREDPARDPRKDGGGIPRARPDLEHPVAGRDLERLRHECDDVGLRDRLAALDRQRGVAVGEFLEVRREKRLARHLGHGSQHALVLHPAGRDLGLHHVLASRRDGGRSRFPFRFHLHRPSRVHPAVHPAPRENRQDWRDLDAPLPYATTSMFTPLLTPEKSSQP